MIKHKNLGSFLLQFCIASTISATATAIAMAVAPFTGFITNIFATIGVTASGVATTRLDINKNGTSIYSSSITQLTFVGTNATVSYGTLSTDPVSVNAGDVITVDVDIPGNDHKGAYIAMLLERTRNNAIGSAYDLSTLP